MDFLDKIPYPTLVIVAIAMALAPFVPMPHLLEKLIMLKNGELHKPLDIFDLIMHGTPLVILLIKILRDISGHR